MNSVRWIRAIVIHPRWTSPRYWQLIQQRIEKRDARP